MNFKDELDPRHDFDRIKFYNHIAENSLKGKFMAQAKNLKFFVFAPKIMARGSAFGAIVGSLTSVAAGLPPEEGARLGAVLGLLIDFDQYSARGLYRYFQAQHVKPKNDLTP